jgi:photosystem II reaction center protein PsbM
VNELQEQQHVCQLDSLVKCISCVGVLSYLIIVVFFSNNICPICLFSPSPMLSVAKTAGKAAFASLPVAAITAPAFALDSVIEAMPSTSVALEVQFGAYLAVTLGTLLPCLFLINLFIQTESRKAGREGGQDSE